LLGRDITLANVPQTKPRTAKSVAIGQDSEIGKLLWPIPKITKNNARAKAIPIIELMRGRFSLYFESVNKVGNPKTMQMPSPIRIAKNAIVNAAIG